MKPTIRLSFWLTLPFKSPKLSRRAHRGQTLIIALAVMFVLLFIGALFVTQIARNLAAAGRSRDTQNAKAFAEAGVKYCKDQLLGSAEGADFRLTPTIPTTLTDPDIQWLSQGFTRLSLTGGRALVRIIYDPNPGDPRSEHIRIEAVGRSGELGVANDPTVFVQTGNPQRLRSERVAYVPMGLQPDQIFVTNKDRGTQEAFLGTPPMLASLPGSPNGGFDPATVFGDPSVSLHPTGINGNDIIIGGSIRANSDLRIGGDANFFFSPRGTVNSGFNLSPEGIHVAGSILLLPTRNLDNGGVSDSDIGTNDLQALVNPPYSNNSLGGATPPVSNTIRDSSDARFDTHAGLVRDNSPSGDLNGYTRGTSRQEPPLIDTLVSGTSTLRYRALTRDSGYWFNGGNNTGFYGYGTGVYLNNSSDRQNETATPGVVGGYSQRGDWLDPKNFSAKGYWQGAFYTPPGIQIELLGTRIRFTRTDGKAFTKPDGSPMNGANGKGGNVLEMPLADIERNNFTLPDGTLYVSVTGGKPLPNLAHDGDEPNAPKSFQDATSYGVNLTVMAEGNVRVKGFYGGVTDPSVSAESVANPSKPVLKLGRVHLNIVSGGTAYIDGNIVKTDGYVQNGKTMLERGSSCMIMAKDYVCVNTTQFISPQNGIGVQIPEGNDPSFPSSEVASGQTFDLGMSFGIPVAAYMQGANPAPLHLMVRHGAAAIGAAPINLFINPAAAPDNPNAVSSAAYPFGVSILPPETYALGKWFDANNVPADNPASISPIFERIAFPLRKADGSPVVPTIDGMPGHENIFRFATDTNASSLVDLAGQPLLGGGAAQDYLLGSVAVAPLDIRIEAGLYAQERSFFVIPGYDPNSDPNDTALQFQQAGTRPSYTQEEIAYKTGLTSFSAAQAALFDADIAAKNRFPFHGQPMDIRVTLNGPVSQNFTASSGDQSAWFARWGYIPTHYGAQATELVPDVHLYGHDAGVNTATLQADYNPAEDRGVGVDFRTALEQTQNITRGLRYTYDPIFAMPYATPTKVALYSGDAATSSFKRQLAALRFKEVKIGSGVGAPITVRQILPPIPNMPVSPGVLYEGEPERPLVQ